MTTTERVLLVDVTWRHPLTSGRNRGQVIMSTYHVAHRPSCKRLKKPLDGHEVVVAGEVELAMVDAWLACAWCLPELMPEGSVPPPRAPRAKSAPVDHADDLVVTARSNAYPSRCERCRAVVPGSGGLLARRGMSWVVVHRDGECHH